MVDVTSKAYKEERAGELAAIDLEKYQLDGVDMRLYRYVREIQTNPDGHNLYEILAVLKFLRLMGRYVFRASKVKKFSRLYESLKFSGMDGRRCYKLTPIQYFQFASMLGFYKWEDVGSAEGYPDKEGKTKKIQDGRRYELRRLVRDVILFVPRKFSKTTGTASLAVYDLLFGDANGQAYTAANSYKQARICFDEISKIVRQLDPRRRYFKSTRELLRWKTPNEINKESFVECLTGGADAKDGLNASMVIYDEYAQARYVKDHSEGAELMQVLTSSMGVRREPMTVIITTASRVEDGPFAIELENAKKVLTGEYEDDTQFASLFMPDAWEVDEDLGRPELWRKCNPHIGITIQEGYYLERYKKALRDAEAMMEFKTKLLNIFVAGGVNVWMSQKLIKTLQVDFDVKNLTGRPEAMVAMDLSVSDDFSVVAYNVYSRKNRKFYGWCDVYIPEETLKEHPNKELYKVWVQNGWMKVCPGAVISASMIVEDVLLRNKTMTILQIGYDSYKSQEVVNALRAAVSSRGTDPDKILRAVPQTYGAFTSPVETFEMAAKGSPPKVGFSRSPIWPYCFGNCYLDEDKMRNKKPLKRKENLKIDAAIAFLMTFWLYNNFEQ